MLALSVSKADAATGRLKKEAASPSKIFYGGKRSAVFKYEISRQADIEIAAVRKGEGAIKKWHRSDVSADKVHKLKWDGILGKHRAAPKGAYKWRVKANGNKLDRSHAKGNPHFGVYPDKFPVRGDHGYGDGWDAGRGHQGQDVFADCGTKLEAARAGKVAKIGYEGSGWGNYLVINTKGENRAHLYAHLKRKPAVHRGDRVKTGDKLGYVGQTGNAQGCHLHFEYWKGRYGSGGHASAGVTKKLKAWDRWS
jgi:murein DD-endopeptidase MepM/ murein hydrolase activator NlpD